MKKYELTSETKNVGGKELHRIRALRDFADVKTGDLGGFLESEKNLSHEGNAWVCGNARVYGDAWVSDNARVCGDAWVCGNARVYGDAWVSDNARVYDNASVCGDASVCSDADCLWIKGLGSMYRTTTFYRTQNGEIGVSCGCFTGNLQEFEAKVKESHGDSKYAKEYLACIEVVKIHFETEEKT